MTVWCFWAALLPHKSRSILNFMLRFEKGMIRVAGTSASPDDRDLGRSISVGSSQRLCIAMRVPRVDGDKILSTIGMSKIWMTESHECTHRLQYLDSACHTTDNALRPELSDSLYLGASSLLC
ncbi:hypothetical protein C8Q80DRAFT_1206251 [Daedaleopsis nitida]|nr:hypothetical protein C8Q80DRAFT_1206251 [Daedaleopsis nitida]